jgi:hypothetical protein
MVVREAVEFAEECRWIGATLALELADYGVERLRCGFARGAAGEALAVLQLAGQITRGFDEPGNFRVRSELVEGGAGPRRLRLRACCQWRSDVSAR